MSDPVTRRCTRCVLPESFPGISFNDVGECNFCSQSGADEVSLTEQLARQMEAAIEENRGNGEYDCIVALSGGKDSSYVLRMLAAERGLNCLSLTIDNGFLSDVAVENCRTVADGLGVDHVFYRPATRFVKQMYVESLRQKVHTSAATTRASNICNSCITLINNYMVKTALQMRVPMVAGGYLSGQVPKNAVTMVLDARRLRETRQAALPRLTRAFGPRSEHYFGIEVPEGETGKVTVLNPLLAIRYDEEDVIEQVKGLGWRMPVDTGKHSSNCRLNDLGIHAHLKQYGFHPYVWDISDLVRRGSLSREEALEKIDSTPDIDRVRAMGSQLGLEVDDL